MYATHPVMVIDPGAIYGKPMSKQKKVMGRILICTDRQTDGRTDGRTDKVIPIYPLYLRSFELHNSLSRIAIRSRDLHNSCSWIAIRGPRFTQLVL